MTPNWKVQIKMAELLSTAQYQMATWIFSDSCCNMALMLTVKLMMVEHLSKQQLKRNKNFSESYRNMPLVFSAENNVLTPLKAASLNGHLE